MTAHKQFDSIAVFQQMRIFMWGRIYNTQKCSDHCNFFLRCATI